MHGYGSEADKPLLVHQHDGLSGSDVRLPGPAVDDHGGRVVNPDNEDRYAHCRHASKYYPADVENQVAVPYEGDGVVRHVDGVNLTEHHEEWGLGTAEAPVDEEEVPVERDEEVVPGWHGNVPDGVPERGDLEVGGSGSFPHVHVYGPGGEVGPVPRRYVFNVHEEGDDVRIMGVRGGPAPWM